jgi:hypothetical protein
VVEPAPVQELHLRVFDVFQRLSPRSYTDVPVRIVDVDDASLERIGQWPWPRSEVGALVNGLFEMGAAVVVFDAVFAEPDRTSPLRLLDGMAGLTVNETLRREIEHARSRSTLAAFAGGRHRPSFTNDAARRQAGGGFQLAVIRAHLFRAAAIATPRSRSCQRQRSLHRGSRSRRHPPPRAARLLPPGRALPVAGGGGDPRRHGRALVRHQDGGLERRGELRQEHGHHTAADR